MCLCGGVPSYVGFLYLVKQLFEERGKAQIIHFDGREDSAAGIAGHLIVTEVFPKIPKLSDRVQLGW